MKFSLLSRWRGPRSWPTFFGPASRVALGLVGLMVMLLLLSDVLFRGFLPDPTEQARRERALSAQLLAGQVAQSLQLHGEDDLRTVFSAALRRDRTLRSCALVFADGHRVSAGPHDGTWKLAPGAASTAENVRSALTADGEPIAELQLGFEPVLPAL